MIARVYLKSDFWSIGGSRYRVYCFLLRAAYRYKVVSYRGDIQSDNKARWSLNVARVPGSLAQSFRSH